MLVIILNLKKAPRHFLTASRKVKVLDIFLKSEPSFDLSWHLLYKKKKGNFMSHSESGENWSSFSLNW